jgi:hypothetical protein
MQGVTTIGLYIANSDTRVRNVDTFGKVRMTDEVPVRPNVFSWHEAANPRRSATVGPGSNMRYSFEYALFVGATWRLLMNSNRIEKKIILKATRERGLAGDQRPKAFWYLVRRRI